MQRRIPVLIAAFGLLLALPAPLRAIDIQVTLLGDATDPNPGDGICDIDPSTPAPVLECTVRAAVQTANALAGPDKILLREANHVLTLVGAGEDDAETGDLDVTSEITIEGPDYIAGLGYSTSFIDAKKLKDRIFDVQAGGMLTLNGVSLLFGKTAKDDFDAAAPGEVSGGCIRSAGTTALDEIFLFRCSSSDDGGCLSVIGGTTTVINSIFSACRAKNEGGAVEIVAPGSATLTNVAAGACQAGAGGAIAARGALTLDNSTLTINKAKRGGAAAVLGAASATITHSTLTTNGTSNLASETTGTVTVTNSILSGAKTDCVGPVVSGGGNLEEETSCAFTGPNDQQNQDPLLLPLAFNNTTIPVHGLAETSPAIDHGLDPADACLDRDSIDRLRVDIASVGVSVVDSGAVEFGGTSGSPTFTSTPDTDAIADTAYTYPVVLLQGRAACRVFSLTVAPTGMTIDPASGLIAWTPAGDQVGTHAVKVLVSDSSGASNTQSFDVVVAAAAP